MKSKSGRKKVPDPKYQLCLYVEQSIIDKIGGVHKTREYLHQYLNVFKS